MVPAINNHKKPELKGATTTILIIMIIEKEIMGTLTHNTIRTIHKRYLILSFFSVVCSLIIGDITRKNRRNQSQLKFSKVHQDTHREREK